MLKSKMVKAIILAAAGVVVFSSFAADKPLADLPVSAIPVAIPETQAPLDPQLHRLVDSALSGPIVLSTLFESVPWTATSNRANHPPTLPSAAGGR